MPFWSVVVFNLFFGLIDSPFPFERFPVAAPSVAANHHLESGTASSIPGTRFVITAAVISAREFRELCERIEKCMDCRIFFATIDREAQRFDDPQSRDESIVIPVMTGPSPVADGCFGIVGGVFMSSEAA